MDTVLTAVTSASVDPNIGAGLQGDLQSIGGTAVGDPVGRRGDQVGAGSPAFPDVNALFGEGPARLAGLVSGGLPSADDLWGPLTGGLGGLESALGSGLGGDMPAVFERIRAAAVAVPDNANLIGAARRARRPASPGGPARWARTPRWPRTRSSLAGCSSARPRADRGGAGLARRAATEQIQSALAEEADRPAGADPRRTGPLPGEPRRNHRGDVAHASRNAVLQRLIPEGKPTARGGDRRTRLRLGGRRARGGRPPPRRAPPPRAVRRRDQAQLGQVSTLVSTFGAATWAQRAASAATTASQLQTVDHGGAPERRDALTSARSLVAGVSPQSALQPLRDAVAQLGPLAELSTSTG